MPSSDKDPDSFHIFSFKDVKVAVIIFMPDKPEVPGFY
jgi:hypothetical protein